MSAEIAASSLEYVRVPVAATEDGAPVNPTAGAVQMAFVDGAGTPEAGDLKTASWETDTSTEPDTYKARCLVGPGGAVTLVAGTTYTVWVKVTDTPEVPVRRAGLLRVI